MRQPSVERRSATTEPPGTRRLWTYGALMLSALVCAGIMWMSLAHRRAIQSSSEASATLRAARVDLARGMLHLISSDTADGDRDQGLVLLQQAASGLGELAASSRRIVDRETADQIQRFEARVAAIRDEVVRQPARLDPGAATALRAVLFRLERDADRVERRIGTTLQQISTRADVAFRRTLFGSTVLLSLLCAGVFVVERGQHQAMLALRRSEIEMREDRNRFSILAATVPSVVHSYRLSAEGVMSFPYASPRIEEVYGVSLEDLAADAAAIKRVWHPDDAPRLMAAAETSRRNLTPWREEFRVLHPRRGEIWIEGHSMPVAEADGSVTWHGVLTDITHRKQGEAAIQERLALEAHLSMLADTSPAVMYTCRMDANGTMSFPFATRRLEDLLGIAREVLAGDAGGALAGIHRDDIERVRASIAESGRTAQLWTESFRYHHPDRGLIWIDTRATPRSQGDGATIWYGFALDVTARQLLELQLRQSQKMDAIGQLAGGVAHDFNNLLTVIQGNASLLSDSVPPELAESLDEIAKAADRAAGLTRQLLLFSRKQVMQAVDLDLNEVLGNMTKLLQRILGEHISLHADFAPGLPLVHADPGMMEQVLLNLAVNSRDAMPQGGRLAVATSSGHGTAEQVQKNPEMIRGPYVALTVSDTGCGIAPDILPRIFEPFFTTKEAGKGTGLGLATVYGIVRQHEGGIQVESQPGAGTTFRILLPARAGRLDACGAQARSALPRGSEVILVVEDEPAVRRMTAAVLQRCGYEVVTAESGRQALQMWDSIQARIDLVVTDMVMPDGIMGPELVRRLQADRPDLKAIFTSGYSPEMAGAGGLLHPGVNFLQKPYRFEELGSIVRRRLDEERSVVE